MLVGILMAVVMGIVGHSERTVVTIGKVGSTAEDAARFECNIEAELDGIKGDGIGLLITNVNSCDPEEGDSVDTAIKVGLNIGKMATLGGGICNVGFAATAEACCSEVLAVAKALVVRPSMGAKGVSWPSFFGVLCRVCPGRPGTPPAALLC
jgi:hypothetical protein